MTHQRIHTLIFVAFVGTALVLSLFAEVRPPDVPRLLSQLVGISLGVEPNQYNAIAGELHGKEVALNEREADLAAREEALAAARTKEDSRRFLYVFVGGVLLAALICLNFFLDYRRRNRNASVVDAPQAPQ